MGWINEEFEYQERGPAGGEEESAREKRLQRAAKNKWNELVQALENDIQEFNRHGGAASLSKISETEIQISNDGQGLEAAIRADLMDQNIRYEYKSTQQRVASPEGGILAFRTSPTGHTQLFSADQLISSEDARRLLLQPVLFPTDTSLPQSA